MAYNKGRGNAFAEVCEIHFNVVCTTRTAVAWCVCVWWIADCWRTHYPHSNFIVIQQLGTNLAMCGRASKCKMTVDVWDIFQFDFVCVCVCVGLHPNFMNVCIWYMNCILTLVQFIFVSLKHIMPVTHCGTLVLVTVWNTSYLNVCFVNWLIFDLANVKHVVSMYVALCNSFGARQSVLIVQHKYGTSCCSFIETNCWLYYYYYYMIVCLFLPGDKCLLSSIVPLIQW